MADYRLFAGSTGPASAISYSGPFLAGVAFEVTQADCWFEGYWWWVAPTGGLTAPQTFAVWLITGPGTGILIPSATVTSGQLAPGWNWVPLADPIQLPIGGSVGTGGANFIAATGVNGSFPDTNGQFAAGAVYASGVTVGPLTAFSDQAASNPGPFSIGQGLFSTLGTDPTTVMPLQTYDSANFWIDVQVGDTPPAAYAGSYRLWPNFPNVTNGIAPSIDTGTQTTGTLFSLSAPCRLANIWLYSPAGVNAMPARTQVWDAATQSLVVGSDLPAAWSGPVGSGWVANAYSKAGIVLPAGNYIVSVFNDSGQTFYQETRGYFGAFNGVAGPGQNGLVSGPLSSPANANSIAPPGGNSCFYSGGTGPTYPNAWDQHDGGENRWVDVEVIPVGGAGGVGGPPVNSAAFMAFFP
ncbi:MAG: hypothetical protein M0Z30_10875 [Actinomycetota bacterium]|nr:hypothetical protein [Actinomycetota bacterium]